MLLDRKQGVALAALAALLLASARSAEAQSHFRRDGTTLQKDGAPYRAFGLNKFDLGTEIQGIIGGRPRSLSVDMAVKALGDGQDRGAAFFRFSSWGYGKDDFAAWKNDPATWAARFTELLDRAGERNVLLVPTLCWNLQAVADLTGEPLGTIVRDENSQGYIALRDFVRDFATRFKDRPEILLYELTNELNLIADLDLTARGGKPGDNFSTDDMIGFVRRLANELRAIDATRPITTGYGSPRPSAAHLRRSPEFSGHADWTQDSDSEQQGYVKDTHPDPIDVISVHAYDAEVNLLGKYKRAADLAGKPIFCGEFGDSKQVVTQNPQAAGQTFRAFLAQLEANGFALGSVWDFEFFQFDPSVPDPFSMIPNVNDDLFQVLRAANERFGVVPPLDATPTAPRAIVSQPLDASTLASGSSVQVYVHASDRGTIASVELFVDGTSVGSTAQYPFQISWTATASGTHELVARVTNGSGLSTNARAVHVSTPRTATTPPSLLTLDGTGTGTPIGWFQRHQADGTFLAYESLFQYDSSTGKFSAVPVDLNASSGQRVFACLYAQNASGSLVTASVGGVDAKVTVAPSAYPGYDQVNIELPTSLAGRGTVDLTITSDGVASNTVQIAIK